MSQIWVPGHDGDRASPAAARTSPLDKVKINYLQRMRYWGELYVNHSFLFIPPFPVLVGQLSIVVRVVASGTAPLNCIHEHGHGLCTPLQQCVNICHNYAVKWIRSIILSLAGGLRNLRRVYHAFAKRQELSSWKFLIVSTYPLRTLWQIFPKSGVQFTRIEREPIFLKFEVVPRHNFLLISLKISVCFKNNIS